ncbi:hypothetical protein PENTCL1PPCAC_22356, partial [Pristionchus entomophagus]
FSSLLRTPTVTRSMVDIPTATSISPTIPSRNASSDPTCNQISTTDNSGPWMISPPPPSGRGRDMTRRRDQGKKIIPFPQEQRSRSLPPPSRTTRVPVPPSVAINPNAPIIAYTDASCVQGRASGIGVFVGDNHPLNTSKPLSGPEHNSGIGEIIAAQTALIKILEWKQFNGQPVIIRTDYMGVIDAMNNGNYGRFSGLYADLRRLAERFPSVTFEHVYGHDGEIGNEMADQLARDAIRLRRRSVTPDGRKGERSRSISRQGRSRSVTIKKSPPKVSDTSTVPPPDKSRSRSRSRSKSRNRDKSRAEVIKGVSRERSKPSNSVRSMLRSERQNEQRQRKKS